MDTGSLPAMLQWYKLKYGQNNELIVLKSLIYFDDADEAEWPAMIIEPDLKWKNVKKNLQKQVITYSKSKIK